MQNFTSVLPIASEEVQQTLSMLVPRARWPPARYGIRTTYHLNADTMEWNGNVANPVPALELRVREDGYYSLHAGQNVNAGNVVTEFGGDIHLVPELEKKGLPSNWFLSIPGYRHIFTMDGARRAPWPLRRHLEEHKVGSFANSSRIDPAVHNHAGANAVIEWLHDPNPRLMRAVLRARVDIRKGDEILWDYPWV